MPYLIWQQWFDGTRLNEKPSSGVYRGENIALTECGYFTKNKSLKGSLLQLVWLTRLMSKRAPQVKYRHSEQWAEGEYFFSVPYLVWQQWFDDSSINEHSSHGGYRGEKIALTERGYFTKNKSLKGSFAWDSYEKLADLYLHIKTIAQQFDGVLDILQLM